jgi:hypothetical protein
MHMTLCFTTGRRMDSVLLAASKDRMRLAVRDRNETVELRFEQGKWVSEDGGIVEIDAIVWNGNMAVPDYCGQSAPKTRTAGGM